METSRTHFRATTVSQRQFLFEAKEQTGSVTRACQRARVSRGTYYHWVPRYETSGLAGIGQSRSSKPHTPQRISDDIATKVIAMRRAHPNWGKQRIADELAKANNWQRVVSPNTVRRILTDANLWHSEPSAAGKSSFKPVARTADKPGQTVNVDLCLAPIIHTEPLKLPAVSCSSGRLVVERPALNRTPAYPGQVFADPDLSYDEAMTRFVEASTSSKETALTKASGIVPAQDKVIEALQAKAQRQLLRLEEERLRLERRQVRGQRRAEDALWRNLRDERRRQKTEPLADPAKRQAQQRQWDLTKKQRQEITCHRQEQDRQWRVQRQLLREHPTAQPLIPGWYAMLVAVDNCSRKSYGVPLFTSGVHVTAKEVVDALKKMLPPELHYLITDRGAHFRADDLKDWVREATFDHVFTARHRPQSNGIAERFVRTLKEWLLDKTWSTADELDALLKQFDEEYNDRPHQGLSIPGLSPNEFERRMCAKGG